MAVVKRQIRTGIELGYLATEEAERTENMDGLRAELRSGAGVGQDD